MTYDDLKGEYRLTDHGDPFGTSMAWLFAISDILHLDRDSDVPETEWGYRPSPIQTEPDTGEWETEFCRDADTSDLIAFGRLLGRHIRICKATGRSY